jgi:glycosyltransferase involved in cell wall biosynthesis
MKILRVTSDLYPFLVGGIGVHTHKMSEYQDIHGEDVTVFTLVNRNETRIPNVKYKIVKFSKLFSFLGNSISPSLLIKLYQNRHNYDIIHAHSHLFLSTNMCALIRQLGSSPLVITNHGLISQTAPHWMQRIFIPTIAKWTFKSADRILCYTIHEKDELIELGIDPKKIAVIHNGIDTDVFIPKRDTSRSRTILWIGRYTPGKGVQYLIDAFARVVQRHPQAHLLMIGDGPQMEEIQQKIQELGLSTYITQKTFVPNEDLPALYQSSDVFVLPSLSEGIPRTILESMACGTPIVCTDLPQLVDLVKGAGLLVPTRNPEAIASAITKIFENPEFASELGKTGTERIDTYYSWIDTVERTLSLYNEVLCQQSA